MVRLVFRPYTQIRRSICTSEPLRASTRVSSGFTLFRHSSPSFGSQQLCSYSNPSEHIRIGRWCTLMGPHLRSLSLRVRVLHPNTRIDVRLLFSKFFSSFHHCTCSLSVSRQYLALDGIYHPLRAAFPNNSTRRRNFTQTRVISSHGILTLCDVLFQGT